MPFKSIYKVKRNNYISLYQFRILDNLKPAILKVDEKYNIIFYTSGNKPTEYLY